MKHGHRLERDAQSAQPLLPLDFNEQIELVMLSPALRAFARRRVGHILYRGHSAESDLGKSVGQIASEAQYRLSALRDIVGGGRMNLPPGRRSECLKYIEGAGAVILALWERVQVEVPEE